MQRLFKEHHFNSRCVNLLQATFKLKNFSPSARFNPYRDKPDLTYNCGEVVETYDGTKPVGEQLVYKMAQVSSARRSNFKNGITRLTDGFIAAIFLRILKQHGLPQMMEDWANYIEDMKVSLIPGNAYKVAEMINSVIRFEAGVLPNQEKLFTNKMLALWMHNWKISPDDYCAPLTAYDLPRNSELYKAFKITTGLSSSSANRFIRIKGIWRPRDAFTAMCWCIATGTHPVRLLNYLGYWLTHPSGQPEEFSEANPITQPEEVELKDENGKVVGFETAKPHITASFLYTFALMIKDIPWPKGHQYIDSGLLEFIKCFNLEDFAAMETMKWQPVPLGESGTEYYSSMGLKLINPLTQKEISGKAANKLVPPDDDEKEKMIATGNPLFDIDVEDDD